MAEDVPPEKGSRDAAWSPEIQPEELPNIDQQMRARQLLTEVSGVNMHDFDNIVKETVQEAYKGLPICAQKCIALPVFRHDFLVDEFYTLLEEYLKQKDLSHLQAKKQTFVFQPAVKVEDLHNEEARAHASKIIARVRPEHVARIAARIDELFDEQITKQVSWAPKELQQKTWESWLLENYFDVIQNVCDQDKPHLADFVFQPVVKVEDLPSSELRSQAGELIARVRARHVPEIEARLEELFTEQITKHISWASKELQQQLWASWMLNNYFGVIQGVCDEDLGSAGSQKEAVELSDTSLGMFASPPKRARYGLSLDASSPVIFMSAQSLHCAELPSNVALGLEARVLHVPSELRYVTIPNRYTGQAENVGVMTVLLADRTGPILFEAWRESAETLLRDFSQWESQQDSLAPLLVEVQRFEARDDSRVHKTPMRKLHSSEHTTVTRISTPNRESMRLASIPPHPGLYTTDFTRLVAQPLFMISLAGFVSSVKPETQSSNGVSTREFTLQDSSGKYVCCKAFGRHAGNTVIANNKQIIMYFVTAKVGLSNQTGSLWLFDEAHVVELRAWCHVPPARQLIELR